MEVSNETPATSSIASKATPYQMKSCCLQTVSELVDNNSLMMCQTCESLIKSFEDDLALKKYITFCRSRNRVTHETDFKHYKLVLYRRC